MKMHSGEYQKRQPPDEVLVARAGRDVVMQERRMYHSGMWCKMSIVVECRGSNHSQN